jgi:hypothetical protein
MACQKNVSKELSDMGEAHPDVEELRQFSIDAVLHGLTHDGMPRNRRQGSSLADFRPEKLAAAFRAWMPQKKSRGGAKTEIRNCETDIADGWRLVQSGSKFRIQGLETPDMELVTKNRSYIVLKVPGHSTNMSGVRGMRDDRYIPSEMRAFEIIESRAECMVVREMISWPCRQSRQTK